MAEERQKVLTVAFTDVEGSTALRTRLGDEAADVLFARLDALIAGALERHGGRKVKHLGDGVMATFESPRSAVRWALEVQEQLRAHHARSGVAVRIGINTGEVTVTGEDVAGEAVAAAARVAARAAGGEVLASDVVIQLAGTMPDVEALDRGRHPLKGFPERRRLFEVSSRARHDTEWAAPLVGRDREIEALDELSRRVAAGIGQVAFVEGEAGIGKSRLLEEVAHHARRMGLEVFRAGADELERERPFHAVLAALPVDIPSMHRDDADLGGDLSDRTLVVVDAVLNELEVRSAGGPLLLILDDLHWSDPATLRTCRAIVRRLAHLRVGLLLAARPAPRFADLDSLITEALAAGGFHVCMPPLDGGALGHLARAELAADPDPSLVEHLLSSGGNPLYALELLRSLGQDGAISIASGTASLLEATVPPGLRLTILRRLSAQPREVLTLLKTASVLGSRFSLTELAAMVDQPPSDLLTTLEDALRAGILAADGDDLAFRHDLIRESLYEELAPAARRALHRQAAERLAACGTSPERVAAHVLVASDKGDAAAVQWLHEAARQVGGRSAASATRLLEHARRLADATVPGWHDISVELADALVRCGKPLEAIGVLQEALEAGAPEVTTRNALIPAMLHLGRHAEALVECERLLARPDLDAATRHSLEAMGSQQHMSLGRIENALEWATWAIEGGDRVDDSYAVSVGLSVRALAALATGDIRSALVDTERATTISAAIVSPRSGYVAVYFARALALVDADQFPEAIVVIDAGRRRAESTGMIVWMASFAWLAGAVSMLAGDAEDALTHVEVALALAGETEATWTGSVVPGALLSWLSLQRGDLAAATAAIAAAHEIVRRSGMGLGIDLLLWADGLRAEAAGEERAEELAWAAWSLMSAHPHLLTRRIVAADVVRLLLKTARDRAEQVVTTLEEAARLAPEVSGRVGAALRCRAVLDGDPDMAMAAAEHYRKSPRQLELTWTLEDAGGLLADAGRTAEATRVLEEALAAYEQMGCIRAASRVQARLRKLGVRRRRRSSPAAARVGWESLTPTERDVVSLVVEGLTNRQIGERLYVSRRTVETHLSHVFAKLGVANRAHLAAEAAGRVNS